MTLERSALEQLLPHKDPILMLDRVTHIIPGASGTGFRRFEACDQCFAGHFPGKPILPGVLTIEAFAQTAAVVLLVYRPEMDRQKITTALGKVKEMSFYAPITPGHDVRFRVYVDRSVGP